MIGLLREGDELVPEWVGGNRNESMRKAGLTKDEFKLQVRRTVRGKTVLLTFFLDDVIVPIGSSAAMIRP